ncbi:short-chain dehydrogenase TIC 32, chloroplastic-like [Miscanthus floridulus]|uniref:short-chain dehydrogenase TIC 32, chloroplastic-like n=1 Tax=Miscanthus floridulus TaxID=154761 RepID=UPI003458E7B5
MGLFFSRASTAEEVSAGVDGHGLVAIITGASSGIGLETARVMALRGVHIIMAVRNVSAGLAAKEDIVAKVPGARVNVLELDLSSMASVRRFAAEFESLNLPLNILINNAGVITKDSTASHYGLELHFATDIGHFLLTNLLLENMKRTCKEGGVEGRIVNVSSLAHHLSYPRGICFSKICNPSGSNTFKGFMAYCQSKLANILHSSELSRILKDGGINISANAVHPGVIVTKNSKNMPIVHALMVSFGRIFGRSIDQGAATTCYVAMQPQVKGISGKFFDNCNIAKPSSQASDAELAKKLWQFSLQTVSS